MNLLIVVPICVLIAVLLYVLAVWQRRIEDEERRKTVAELRDAKEMGTDKPLAQYPHIDAQSCIGCGTCIVACPEDEVLGLVDGVARVIHGARCVGHGNCGDVCPVGAITVGLGDTARRPDIPILSESFETSVPGLYIAGELGGFALIRIAVEQGTRVIEALVEDLRAEGPRPRGMTDVLIVGAGPAGIAATLKAVERGLSHVTIDQDDLGGTVRKYPRRKLVITGSLELPLHGPVRKKEFIKEELIDFWQSVFQKHRLEIRSGIKLLGIERQNGSFLARTSGGDVRARRVLLALGRRGIPRRLGVPGEELEKVLYNLIETASYKNEHILVVGGGDSAIEAATGLANQLGNKVTLSYRRDRFFRLKARNQERIEEYLEEGRVKAHFGSQVKAIEAGEVLLSVTTAGGEQAVKLPNDYVFIFAGGEPPFPLLKGMGIKFGGDGNDRPEEPDSLVFEATPGRAGRAGRRDAAEGDEEP